MCSTQPWRRFVRVVSALGLFAIAGVSAARAQSTVDTFNPGADDEVWTMAIQPDGKLLVGGAFRNIGDGGSGANARNYLARLNPDGSLDTSFFDTQIDGAIETIALQPDGRILIGGLFSELRTGAGIHLARRYIARLNADGTADETFDPGADALVYAIKVQPDGRILVGGGFAKLGGGGYGVTERRCIGRLNADGSLDATFDVGCDAVIRTIAVQPDGRILVGGAFSTLGGGDSGHVSRHSFARLNADGSVDPAYQPAQSGSTFVLQPDGKVLLDTLRRLNADGSVDTSFDAAVDGVIYAMAPLADGRIVVGGQFFKLGPADPLPTTPRKNVGRLNADGSIDTTFDPGANDVVYGLAIDGLGRLYLGGAFTGIGGSTGTTPRNRLARMDTGGSLDAGFDAGANDAVRAIAAQPDGRVILGGDFTTLGGATHSHLGRLNADGSIDETFNAGGDEGVLAVLRQTDGKILVAGRFTMLADGVTGASRSYIGRLNADGTIDTSFNPGANNFVTSLALQPNGQILVGGSFTGLGGGNGALCACSHIGRLNADGSVDTTFAAAVDGTVYALAYDAFDGGVWVGGDFTSPALRILRLNGDGTRDTRFVSSADNTVTSLFVQPGDGAVIVGGGFTKLGGTPRRHLGRLGPTGVLDGTYDPSPNGQVVETIPLDGGKLLVGGYFTAFGPDGSAIARNRVAILDARGAVAPSFDPDPDSAVYALARRTDGTLMIGGAFGAVGAAARSHVARLTAPDLPDESIAVVGGGRVVTWTHGGAGPGLAGAAFEWSTDGTSYSPLGDASPVATGWRLTGQSLPLQTVFIRATGLVTTGIHNSSTSRFSLVRTVDIASAAAIAITTEPQGATIGSGNTVTLSVTVEGAEPLSYQWYAGTSGVTSSPVAGATAATFTTPVLTTTTSFWVRVSNPAGSADSAAAVVTVIAPPVIATQPQSALILAGSQVNLSVVATGTGLSYQWYQGASSDTASPIAGETGSEYETPVLNSTTSFWVRISNLGGSTDSSTATLTIVTPPVLTTVPPGLTVIESGTTATLTAAASGLALTYTWYKECDNLGCLISTNGAPGSTNTVPGNAIVVGTGPTFTTPALTSIVSYYVRASNIAGHADSEVAVVAPRPTIGIQPQSQSVTAGSSVLLAVTATGNNFNGDALRFQWYAGISGVTSNPLVGETFSTFQTPALQATASYWVRVTNIAGSADSNTAVITIADAAAPMVTLQPASQTVIAGADVTFTAAASGTPTPTVQWEVSTDGGGTFSGVAGGTSGILTFTTAASDNDKRFRAVFTNSAGSATSSTATLTVATTPSPPLDLTATAVGFSGIRLRWTAPASGPATSYTVRRSLVPLGDLTTVATGVTNTRYVDQGLAKGQTFFYVVTAVNGAGESTGSDSVPGTTLMRAAPLDFDGDGTADLTYVRAGGGWNSLLSSAQFAIAASADWGLPGDVPVAADYDGDGVADRAVYRPSEGNWYTTASSLGGAFFFVSNNGTATDVPQPGDYDGDGKADLAVFRPATGEWFIRRSSSGYDAMPAIQWGLSTDVTVAADYDGDGRTDPAAYRPSDGGWYILLSASNYTAWTVFTLGAGTDRPAVADFDGDGKADPAVYRPANQTWSWLRSGASYAASASVPWGLPGDLAAPADYDGDGKTDMVAFRPSEGTWYVLRSSTEGSTFFSAAWGQEGDVPLPVLPTVSPRANDLSRMSDVDGDAKADLTIFRPAEGMWYTITSSSNLNPGTPTVTHWGADGDVPVPGDYDGDGRADRAVFRPAPGMWYLLLSSTGYSVAAHQELRFGSSGDTPVPGDYDGDGRTDIAVYRPSTAQWFFALSSQGFAFSGPVSFGLPFSVYGDVPVPADYDGDGTTDLAVYRARFGIWYVAGSRSGGAVSAMQLGVDGDTPVPGDYDGDGRIDPAVYRSSTGEWFFRLSAANYAFIGPVPFGLDTQIFGDVPVPGDFDGDGKTDLAVYRASQGLWFVLTSSSDFTSITVTSWGVATDLPILRR